MSIIGRANLLRHEKNGFRASVPSAMIRRKFLKITLPLTLTGGLQAKSVGKPELSFGVIADPQYADQPAGGSRYYRESVGKLKESVNQLNKQSLDFVVTLGDVIDKDIKSFDTMMPIYG